MRILLSILVIGATLSGCFVEPETFPKVPVEQHQFIPTTNEICSNVDGEFDHFIFSGYPESDSIQWYQIAHGDTAFIGTGNPIEVPVSQSQRSFFCYQFYPSGDTVLAEAELFYCIQGFYIPNTFSPRTQNGWNDCLQILYSLHENPVSEAHWKVLTNDGVTLFETGSINECWDGKFNGEFVPSGSYLIYVELLLESGESYTHTGVLTVVE